MDAMSKFREVVDQEREADDNCKLRKTFFMLR